MWRRKAFSVAISLLALSLLIFSIYQYREISNLQKRIGTMYYTDIKQLSFHIRNFDLAQYDDPQELAELSTRYNGYYTLAGSIPVASGFEGYFHVISNASKKLTETESDSEREKLKEDINKAIERINHSMISLQKPH